MYTQAFEYIQCINQKDISVLRVPPYLHLLGNHLKKTDENHLKSFLHCMKSWLRELWNELTETLEHLLLAADWWGNKHLFTKSPTHWQRLNSGVWDNRRQVNRPYSNKTSQTVKNPSDLNQILEIYIRTDIDSLHCVCTVIHVSGDNGGIHMRTFVCLHVSLWW